MSIPRAEPYIWVSWLAKLLTGEAHCQWALWFRAHYQYERTPSDFDRVAWNARHAALVGKTVDSLRKDGWEVRVEEQNKFAVPGRTATLAGKPDIVAAKGDLARVIDCKTGSPKGSDCMQVLVYMLVLPHARPEYRGTTFSGEVRYSDCGQSIDPAELTPELQGFIWTAIKQAARNDAPRTTPSTRECRFCDITGADCADRLEPQPESQASTCELF